MFTEEAREAIGRAQDQAREMGHWPVQVEHLLLGLFSDQDGIAGRVLADFGVTIEPVRDLVRERLGLGSGPVPEGSLGFSPEAKTALRWANRIGLGEPGTAQIQIMIIHPTYGVWEILRAVGADPKRIRFETEKRADPSSVAGRGAGPSLHVRTAPLGSFREVDFGN